MSKSTNKMNSELARYAIFVIIEIMLLISLPDSNLEKITPWLLGINFTIAAFSINFTFFGYQLSKYQSIYTRVTNRQWVNITILLITPFVPLIYYLLSPTNFGVSALLIMPVMILSAIDNSLLTASYLNPTKFSATKFSKQGIEKYISKLSSKTMEEYKVHEILMAKRKEFKTPPHGYRFQPSTLGTDTDVPMGHHKHHRSSINWQ